MCSRNVFLNWRRVTYTFKMKREKNTILTVYMLDGINNEYVFAKGVAKSYDFMLFLYFTTI